MSAPVDVIVVGGGPVGVTTALLLEHRGLHAVVLERATEIYDLPRAIVLDDEIQRVFQSIGRLDGLRAVTSILPGGEFVDAAGTRIIGAEIPDGMVFPLGHPPVVRYYQPELEAFIRRAAVDAGVDLRLGVRVDAVEPDTDRASVGVRATLADGTPVHLTAPWVIAADGASSPIRKSLGIAFEDQGFDQDWLVVDLELTDPEVALPRLAQQCCDPERPATFIPGHGPYRRWEFQLQPDDDRERIATDEAAWSLLAPWIRPDQGRLVRSTVYRFHALVAERMRAGRVFLAGDAAHQMPPFLGQGLCSGIRDAANLAWKLAAVHRGVAPDALLDTYDIERRPHAAGVVAHAVDTGRLIDQLAGRSEAGVDLDSAYGGARPFPHLEAGFLAGEHPLVGRQLPQPILDGTPLDDLLGHQVAVVVRSADPGSPPDPELVAALDRWRAVGARIVAIPTDTQPRIDLVASGAVVVRPDRYVAAVTDDAAALHRVADELLPLLGTGAADAVAAGDRVASGTHVVLTGTGIPHPTPGRAGPGALVRVGDLTLQFDAGRGTVLRLAEAGAPPSHLTALFLTHVHSDHVVDVADVAMTRWIQQQLHPTGPLTIVAPRGETSRFVERMFDAYRDDIRVRREHVGAGEPGVDLRTFEVTESDVEVWRSDTGHVVVEATAVRHEPVHGAVGYRVTTPDGVVVISGDTRVCAEVERFAAGADVLVHEACRSTAMAPLLRGTVFEQIFSYHADTVALGAMAERIGVPHLVLTHLIPSPTTEDEVAAFEADVRAGGYTGRVTVGRDLDAVSVTRADA